MLVLLEDRCLSSLAVCIEGMLLDISADVVFAKLVHLLYAPEAGLSIGRVAILERYREPRVIGLIGVEGCHTNGRMMGTVVTEFGKG